MSRSTWPGRRRYHWDRGYHDTSVDLDELKDSTRAHRLSLRRLGPEDYYYEDTDDEDEDEYEEEDEYDDEEDDDDDDDEEDDEFKD